MNINLKNRDPSLNLEGLIAAQNRLPSGHPSLPILAAKQASVEARIGGEERVAKVFRKHSFPFDHRTFHVYHPHLMSIFKWTTILCLPGMAWF
ncbi:hypothetical protein PH210_16375 [Paenibacillus sp. BSR1-1]|uniref:hypothetical protein n=1 Tax=Paenibacillus sp. BSR1-1 TaxID=3020845 RepID=UPI0025B212D0|nr:hypothetical protein [Paenibacillus sp. BSR1-1]MDN3017776.1 hypothetical protein [Paenibacillus sp. BSR1-1]